MKPSRHIIVDAYNMIHRVRDLRTILQQNLEQSRIALVNRLAVYKRQKRVRVTAVFDGASVGLRSTARKSGIEIIFSSSPQDADTLIKNLVLKSPHRASVLVVSSDRSVADYARSMGAESMKSEQFFNRFLRLQSPHPIEEKYDQHLSEKDVQEWLDLFNGSNPPEDET